MKNKNGFFSMSLVYSFFLVFAMLSAILLANYAHNRLLVKDYNVDIKEDLNQKGNEKLAYLRNILNNSDFEVATMSTPKNEYGNNAQWALTGATRINNQKYSGSYGMDLAKGTARNKLTQTLNNIVLKKNHIYYFQYSIFTANNVANFTSHQVYLYNAKKNYKYYFVNQGSSSHNYASWTLLSSTIKTGDIAEISGWQLIFEINGLINSNVKVDSFMLVDLTESYGSTVPSASWFANNIGYFEVNYVHPKSDIK